MVIPPNRNWILEMKQSSLSPALFRVKPYLTPPMPPTFFQIQASFQWLSHSKSFSHRLCSLRFRVQEICPALPWPPPLPPRAAPAHSVLYPTPHRRRQDPYHALRPVSYGHNFFFRHNVYQQHQSHAISNLLRWLSFSLRHWQVLRP